MLEQLAETVKRKADYAREWKRKTGRPVVGYFCCYAPEELIYAAGALPVRIVGAEESPTQSDRHVYGMFCPFCRSCVDQGLKGRYDYLDGVVWGRTCIHISHAFDTWKKHMGVSFSHLVYVPAVTDTPAAQSVMRAELEGFKASLEEWTGTPITREALADAIEVYNTNRRLLRQAYALRKSERPLLSGAEAMEMVLSSMFMDKREHNDLLRRALDELPGRKDSPEPGVRLMMVGSELDNPKLLRLVEGLGATVVIDDLCMGTRYFWNEVEVRPGPHPDSSSPSDRAAATGQDLLGALAARYLHKPTCPTKHVGHQGRLDFILGLAREYQVQGMYLVQQKFCDTHELDFPAIQDKLKEENIPSLFIELEMTIPEGQIRTRTEAFLEMLELELV